MASTCENYLDDIDAAYYNANWQFDMFLEPLQQWFKDERYTHDNFNDEWRVKISALVTTVTAIHDYLIHGNWQGNWPYRLPYYLRNCVGADPYELTAKKICEAWAKNSFEDRAVTIAFIDRMRQILWDEPFYVQWAAKPVL